MYFKKITSNIKGAGEHELDPCTVITGKSGQGKSAIVDSFNLVLAGEAKTPGLGKRLASLKSTLPEGEEQIALTGVLDDDSVVDITQSGSALGYRWSNDSNLRLVGHDYAGAVEDLLLGQPARIAKRIVEASGDKIAWHRLAGALPSEMAGELLGFFRRTDVSVEVDGNGIPIGSQEFPATSIGKVLEAVKAEMRKVKKDLKEANGATKAPAEPLSAEEQGELTNLVQLKQQIAYAPTSPEDANAELQKVYTQIAELEQAQRVLPVYNDADLARVRADCVMLQSMVEVLEATLPVAQQQGACCPTCGVPISAEAIQTRIVALNGVLEQSLAWLKQAEEVTAERSNNAWSLQQAEVQRNRLTEIITQGSISAQFDQQRLSELETRRAIADRTKKALSNLPKFERRNEDLDVLKKALEAQIEQAAIGAVSTIERRVNKFLPRKYRAKIATDGQSIAMSLNGTAGPFHDYRALSKAQRTLLGIGLAAATIPSDAPPVRALIIDEVPMDTTTAKTMMKAIAEHVAKGDGFSQAVVSLVSLTGKTPDGWRQISVDPVTRRGKRTEEKETTDE